MKGGEFTGCVADCRIEYFPRNPQSNQQGARISPRYVSAFFQTEETTMAVSPDITREILRHIQDNRVMPKSLPGVDPEDLHNEFTRLWRKGLITSDREPIVTGTR